MATAQDVIDRAGGILGIVSSPGAAVDATTSTDMLTVLQDFISEMGERGALEIPAPSAVGTTLDVSPGTIRGLAYNLANDYSETIGRELGRTASQIAAQTKSRLIARSTVSRQVDFSADGLGVSHSRYNINSDA